MKLDRLILVNWGQIRPGDYDMGDLTLLTGETGSGKSTMLDGLQTVMTAAYAGILNYNPGQDEVTQGQRRGKTKRSVESYVVGAEYSKFSRPDGAQGYLAAVFRPSKGESGLQSFTAVIAVSARVDGAGENRQAKLESFVPFIVDGAALTYSDFMIDPDEGKSVPVEQIVRKIKGEHPRVHEFHDRKRDYLSALYGRFRGKNGVSWDEASQAARAWVQSIAYRPIGSVHELVREEILSHDPKQLQQEVESISALMRRVAGLREEGERLQQSVVRLDTLAAELSATSLAHEAHIQQELVVAKLQKKLDEDRLAACAKQVRDAEESILALKARIALRDKRAQALDQKRTILRARLADIPVAQQKEELERKLSDATSGAKRVLSELSQSLIAATLLNDRAREVTSAPYEDGLTAVNAAIQAVAEAYAATRLGRLAEHQPAVFGAAAAPDLNPEQLLLLGSAFDEQSNTGLENLFAAMVGAGDSLQTALTQELVGVKQRVESAEGTIRELTARKTKLAKGSVPYPRDVEVAVQRIGEAYPEANVQVLCDLVEPGDESWQSAIEGYLGGARFNLIVDPDWERRVIDLVRASRWRATVVQGSLCLQGAARASVPSDSIIHELRTSNPIAQAYLSEQFGPVVKVEDTEALRHTRRGVTKNGTGAGSRTMYMAEAKELVFGRKARESQLAAVIQNLKDAEHECAKTKDLMGRLVALQRRLAGLKEPSFKAGELTELALALQVAKSSLQALDLSATADLQKELDALEDELRIQGTDNDTDKRGIYDGENAITGAKKEAANLEQLKLSRLTHLEQQISRAKAIADANPGISYSLLSQAVDGKLARPEVNLYDERVTLDLLSRRPLLLLSGCREALAEYHQHSRTDEKFLDALPHLEYHAPFEAAYGQVVRLLQSVNERLQALRGVGLYTNKVELEEAVRSFNDVFTKNFCAEIKTRVDDGVRTLRQLNNELRSLKFGSDRFSIDYSKWEPEFEEYLDFFNAVYRMTESTETLDLFGDNELSSKHVQIRDRLVELLLDEDQGRATKELLRIADYRNYRRYDIFNDSDSGGRIRLSDWGTGSGGQLETPAYIVRAAVVSNRLKLFEKGPSLRLLVNDESFSKMDEPRARSVLGFLRDNLDLQIISAMPTMKSGALKDEFNREYGFTRLTPVANGELDFVSDCAETVFKQDKMRELWAIQREHARQNARQLFESAEPETAALEEREAVAGGTPA